MNTASHRPPFPQDLHIHTTFSTGDDSVAPEQRVELVAAVKHAFVIGISDHLDFVHDENFEPYRKAVEDSGAHLGVEVDGSEWVDVAVAHPVEYYIYHCRDAPTEYRGAEKLLEHTCKPVIIAHPLALGSEPQKIPTGCLIEVNNRYVWRHNWRARLPLFTKRFEFVIGSDAHCPNWLGQSTARYIARELGIREKLIFD